MSKPVKHSSKSTVLKNNDDIVSKNDVVPVPFSIPKNFLYSTCHTLGHDLKSPLFVVRSYTQLLQRSQDKDHLKRGLTLMNEASYKMENIINGFIELMDIYTISYVEIQSISIVELLQQMRCKLTPNYDQLDQSITEELSINDIKFNESYLNTIVEALLSNAFEHNKNVPNLQITVSTKELRGNKIALIIEDNGVGMDLTSQVTKDKIKQPFYRHDKNEGGIGMGLAKINAIASMTDSAFILDSELGIGTKCTFIIKQKSHIQPKH